MSTYTSQRKHTGRPKGRPNDDRPSVIVVPCRCPACGSSEIFVETGNQTRQEISGTLSDGREFNRVTWRRAACRACGQKMMQRVFEKLGDHDRLLDDAQVPD